MPEAVGNMRGIARFFKDSRLSAIKRWLNDFDEQTRLRQVYLVTLT